MRLGESKGGVAKGMGIERGVVTGGAEGSGVG
jgi:hypothetical protein